MHSTSGRRARRRSSVHDPLRKTSIQMRTSTIEAVRHAVESGAAASQDEFVETAVLALLRELRREKVYASSREAAADPAYAARMDAVSTSFETAVGDGLATGEV